MRKFILVLLALVFAVASGYTQTKRILYTSLAPGATGLGSQTIYGISQTDAYVDSAWTQMLTSNVLGTDEVYTAQKITAADSLHFITGPVTFAASFQQPASATQFYQAARFGKVKITVTREVIDTGLLAIYTAHGGTFVVTGITITGGNDTTGYTSNATTKIGMTGTPYDNFCTSLVPPLGAANTLAATLVSPRKTVPAGTTVYWHVTTAAVATTETAKLTLEGYLQN